MNGQELHALWVYLSASPLSALAATLAVYVAAHWLHQRAGGNALANPVLVSVAVLGCALWGADIDYATYFDGAQFIHFMLGPATVALAVPLYRELDRVRRTLAPLGAALIVGSAVAALSAVGIAWLFDAGPATLASLAPKSVTTPIAMGISEKLGGLPSLTAVLVILTGVLGGVSGTWLLARLGVRDPRAVGFALGLASHGIGTARAFQVDRTAGAYAALAMGLNGLVTALLLPPLFAALN